MAVHKPTLMSDEVHYLLGLIKADLRRRPLGEDEIRGRLAKDALLQLGVPDDEVDGLIAAPRLRVLS